MEPINSMSQILYNQVDQIADVMTCKINDVETKYYKVQWKCTWEPETVLERFCKNVITEYKNADKEHSSSKQVNCKITASLENAGVPKTTQYAISTEVGGIENVINKSKVCTTTTVAVDNISSVNKNKTFSLINTQGVILEHNLDIQELNNKSRKKFATNVIPKDIDNLFNNETFPINIKPDPGEERFPELNILNNSNVPTDSNTTVESQMQLQTGCCSDQLNTNEDSYTVSMVTDGILSHDGVDDRGVRQSNLVNSNQTESEEYSSNSLSVAVLSDDARPSQVDFREANSFNIVENSLLTVQNHDNLHIRTINNTTSNVPMKSDNFKLDVVPVSKCHICSYSTKNKASFKRHLRKHTGERPFQCKLCSYTALDRSAMKRHVLRHTNERNFKCKHCSYRTYRKDHLNDHEKDFRESTSINNINRIGSRCNFCNYVSNNMSVMKKHRHLHIGEIKTSSISTKSDHSAYDEVPKLNKCKICSYSTTSHTNFKRHLRIHTGERPYKCKLCPYSSSDRSTMSRHELRHSNKKSFKCKSCSYLTYRKDYLLSHERSKHDTKLNPQQL